jgi:hypothetical protein
MTCCPRVSTRHGPAGTLEERSMCSRISISISRWPWRRRESRILAAWGATGGASAPGEAWPPRRSPQSPHEDVRPLSGAQGRVALSGCRRGRSLDHAPTGHGTRRRVVPPEGRGQKPQSGQERPPRRRRYAAPALTPRRVAPALVATTATVPSRQTNRRTARGGLSTAMRPIVPSVFVAQSRCLSDRSATEAMPQIV